VHAAVPGAAMACSILSFPKGLQWYWKGDLSRNERRGDRRAHQAADVGLPSALSLMQVLSYRRGRWHRVGAGRHAWSTRDARWSMVIAAHRSRSRAKSQGLKKMGARLWEAIHIRSNLGGRALRTVNFMMDDENDAGSRPYGPN